MTATSYRRIALIVAVLAVALSLRLAGITRESIWLDEAASARYTNRGPGWVLWSSANDTSPPLYYLGLWAWRHVVPDSDFTLRAHSVVWSMIGLLAIFALGNRLFGFAAGIVAMALCALNPLDIYYAQEARMYAQTMALGTLATLFLCRGLAGDPDKRRDWFNWILYGILVLATLLTHYIWLCVALAQGVIIAAWAARRRDWRCILRAAGSAVIVCIGFLGWYAYVATAHRGFATEHMEWLTRQPVREHVIFLWRELFWGHSRAQDDYWPLSAALLVLLGLCLIAVLSRRSPMRSRFAIAALLCLVLLPPVFGAIVSRLYIPMYFRPRFATLLIAPFLLLCAVVITSIARRVVGALIALALCATMVVGWRSQSITPHKTDWRVFAKTWREKGPPEHMFFFPNYTQWPANYYLQTLPNLRKPAELDHDIPLLRSGELWILSRANYTYFRPGELARYRKLLSLGTVTTVWLPTDLVLQTLRVGEWVSPQYKGRFAAWFEPEDVPGKLRGFSDPGSFHAFESRSDGVFRWSKGTGRISLLGADSVSTVVICCEPPPAIPGAPPLDVKTTTWHGREKTTTGTITHQFVASDFHVGLNELQLACPPGPGPLNIEWSLAPVNLKRAGISGDDRDLGLKVRWIATENLTQAKR